MPITHARDINQSLIETKVAVMEDDPEIQQAIQEVMRDELNWQVVPVASSEEAVAIAEKNEIEYYIFDVHMGEDKQHEQEGLDALEKLKEINANLFVSIFTAFPKYRQQAKRLHTDFYLEKSPHIKTNIRQIAYEILNHQMKVIKNREKSLEQQKESLENLLKVEAIDPEPDPSDLNLNINAYEKLKSDPEWLEKYQGKYVAFVEGKQVFPNIQDEKDLLKKIREKYPDKPRFFTQVQKVTRSIPEPSSLAIFSDFVR